MRYLIRAVKYYITMMIVLCLLIVVLVLAKVVEADLATMFVNGYDSLWQIALILVFFSAMYPHFGYSSRNLHLGGGSYAELRPQLVKVMEAKGYVLSSESGENLCFVKSSQVARLFRLWEDALTFTRTVDGFCVEGPTRDIVRVASALQA